MEFYFTKGGSRYMYVTSKVVIKYLIFISLVKNSTFTSSVAPCCTYILYIVHTYCILYIRTVYCTYILYIVQCSLSLNKVYIWENGFKAILQKFPLIYFCYFF